MGTVAAAIVRRIVQVSQGPDRPEALLASVGLEPRADVAGHLDEQVDEDAYYALLERAAGDDDHGLPFRYGDAIRPDDLGALGLALKTAPTVADALRRLVRYILVLSDTLAYELTDSRSGQVLALVGRPHHRRGAALANECALAAVTTMIRRSAATRFVPREVSFRHAAPPTERHHRDFFGCAVRFGAERNGLQLETAALAQRMVLADEGLSAYLLGQLDDLRSRRSEQSPSLVANVRSAIADALPDGQPNKSKIARRMGMSERSLHRRLAEHGDSFQALAEAARREAAESLLRSARHSLADVAFLTGFSDQSAFTRAFKRWTGMTPTAFREHRAER